MKEVLLKNGMVALVDDEDYERVNRYSWQAYKGKRGRAWYARANFSLESEKKKNHFMHRFIVNAPAGVGVDHLDNDGLNNQKENLRLATASQNQQNRPPLTGKASRFKGVTFHRQTGKWRARVKQDNRYVSAGYYFDEVEAAKAYDEKAKELYGDKARLNFPEPG